MVGILRTRLELVSTLLKAGTALWDSHTHVSHEEWTRFVERLRLSKVLPSIQGMGYAALISDNERRALEQSMRAQGFLSFHIFPDGQRERYATIVYIEPFDERNQRAFGFDMLSEPTRSVAIQRALETGDVAISGRVRLRQENGQDEQPGFLLYAPVYSSLSSASGKDAAPFVRGFVFAPVRTHDFFTAALMHHELGFDIRLYDGAEVDPAAELYRSRPSDDTASVESGAYYHRTITFTVAGHPWTLDFLSFEDRHLRPLERLVPSIITWVGILVSTLVTVIVALLMRSRERATAYARHMNEDLQASRNELLKKNGQIQQQLTELERMNALMVGRELKMRELKEQIARPSVNDSTPSSAIDV